MNTKKRQSLVRTEEFINKLTDIDINEKRKISALCRNEKRHLGEGKSDDELEAQGQRKKIAMTTYRRYITSYRNAIKELNAIHPDARENIKNIKEKYPKYSEILDSLDAELPLLRDNIKKVLSAVKSKNTGLYSRIKRLKIEHPAFYYMHTSDSVKDRYTLEEMKKIEVIFTRRYKTGKEAYSFEQKILKKYKQFKYIGPPLLKAGNTELFNKDVLKRNK